MAARAEPALMPSSDATIDVGGRVLPMSSVFAYDVERWPLRPIVAAFFDTDALETLHDDPRWNPHATDLALPSHLVSKNSWAVSKVLRDAVVDAATPVLHALTASRIAEIAGPIRSIQPVPMMRVNFHGSRAILRFHRDVEYGQQPRTINIWLPITRVFGSNSMYVESRPGESDYRPVDLDYGQALMFYGTELSHGTLDNLSGGTRISFDFRFSV